MFRFSHLCAAIGVALLVGSAASADEPTYTLTLKDHAFAPSELTIPARVKVLVVVKNLGDAPAEFESDDFHREKVVTGGSEIKVYVGPLLPGTYAFFDDFDPATRGHLIVK